MLYKERYFRGVEISRNLKNLTPQFQSAEKQLRNEELVENTRSIFIRNNVKYKLVMLLIFLKILMVFVS